MIYNHTAFSPISSCAINPCSARIPSSIISSARQPIPRHGLLLNNARTPFASTMIRSAIQSRGVVVESTAGALVTAAKLHGAALIRGAARNPSFKGEIPLTKEVP